ncbi:hypothetical protein NL676_032546 [Syzygium grande]|nr:hypothetical protein NL676_032546 [Syzygium grande]
MIARGGGTSQRGREREMRKCDRFGALPLGSWATMGLVAHRRWAVGLKRRFCPSGQGRFGDKRRGVGGRSESDARGGHVADL